MSASQKNGGELGLRVPFGHGGYEQAALSAGLACRAISDVVTGRVSNAYSLSRPPGHHCLPDFPNGFCLLANIAVAVKSVRAKQPDLKVAILDWDVHHGNGTEAIFLDDPKTLGRYETGAKTAMPIFKKFVKQAIKKEDARPFKVSDNITMMVVDRFSGLKAKSTSKQ